MQDIGMKGVLCVREEPNAHLAIVICRIRWTVSVSWKLEVLATSVRDYRYRKRRRIGKHSPTSWYLS
jgi:hypothetical protein